MGRAEFDVHARNPARTPPRSIFGGAVDESLLAQGQLTLAEFIERPGQTITNLQGSVPSLDIEAARENWLEGVDVDAYGGGE